MLHEIPFDVPSKNLLDFTRLLSDGPWMSFSSVDHDDVRVEFMVVDLYWCQMKKRISVFWMEVHVRLLIEPSLHATFNSRHLRYDEISLYPSTNDPSQFFISIGLYSRDFLSNELEKLWEAAMISCLFWSNYLYYVSHFKRNRNETIQPRHFLLILTAMHKIRIDEMHEYKF